MSKRRPLLARHFVRYWDEDEDSRFMQGSPEVVDVFDLVREQPMTTPDLLIAPELASPLAMLKLLVICDAFRVYPPVDVLRWLADAAEAYLATGGASPFDELLGLAADGAGKDPPIKALAEAQRKSRALWEMLHLVWREDISGAEAARRIAPDHGYKPQTLQRAFAAFRRRAEVDRELVKRIKRGMQQGTGVRRHRIR